jgi:hypothetical protein
MINNVILDVVIGIVFIFLLYSLLATSIQELIAAIFGFRSQTLEKGIAQAMLANNPTGNFFDRLRYAVQGLFHSVLSPFQKKDPDRFKLGDLFYDHPLVRNYGSGKFSTKPSYLSPKNFSTILLDVLISEYEKQFDSGEEIKSNKKSGMNPVEESGRDTFYKRTEILKIKNLLDLYIGHFDALKRGKESPLKSQPVIDEDTLKILYLLLRNSGFDWDDFTKKLESWFNDTMDRVSGWYKTNVQLVLFTIGIMLATILNVDIMEISGHLSTDKDARDQLVQLAIKESDNIKDNPLFKNPNGDSIADFSKIYKLYQQNLDSTKRIIDLARINGNMLIALGWGDYGKKQDSLKIITKAIYELNESLGKKGAIDSSKNQLWLSHTMSYRYYAWDWVYKTRYVLYETLTNWKKVLSFLLMGFAVCLGAPFWFDSLSKIIQIRAAGKKEGPASKAGGSGSSPAS